MIVQSGPIVQAIGLGRDFGRRRVVEDVDFEVAARRDLALVGPNGAGKSTVLRMLATLVRPTRGSARICGYDVQRDARRARAQSEPRWGRTARGTGG